jgi:hypothetical protein
VVKGNSFGLAVIRTIATQICYVKHYCNFAKNKVQTCLLQLCFLGKGAVVFSLADGKHAADYNTLSKHMT